MLSPSAGGQTPLKVLNPSELEQLGSEDRIAVMNMVKEVRARGYPFLSLTDQTVRAVNATL